MFEFVYICVYTFSRMIYNLLTRYIVFQLELMKLLTLSYIFQLLVRLIYFRQQSLVVNTRRVIC